MDRDPAELRFAPFGGWHYGTANRYGAHSSLAPRLCVGLAPFLTHNDVLCVVPPQHRHPLRGPPGAGSPPPPAVPTKPSGGPVHRHITGHCEPRKRLTCHAHC